MSAESCSRSRRAAWRSSFSGAPIKEKSSSRCERISRIVDLIREAIRDRGPLTAAAFMDLALYHESHGYYVRAAQRSGRAGDFFTSVDVGDLFGALLEVQIAEMADVLGGPVFDLVEAGAGNGRLSADILRAARRRQRDYYDRLRLHLVEASPMARAGHRATLADTSSRLATSGSAIPDSFEGVLLANELLDALPAHAVVMRKEGLREIYVDWRDDRLVTVEGPVSTAELNSYLDRAGVTLEPGWRAEINLQAVSWTREAATRVRRGFLLLIDYGHEARELYSAAHSGGTLTTFAGHRMTGPESRADSPDWLLNPGQQDITAHVDFTSIRRTAEEEGLTTLGYLDQTYFVLGLLGSLNAPVETLPLKQRLALKTLMMPGGLGSTHKVLLLGKGVGRPAVKGCSYRVRAT